MPLIVGNALCGVPWIGAVFWNATEGVPYRGQKFLIVLSKISRVRDYNKDYQKPNNPLTDGATRIIAISNSIHRRDSILLLSAPISALIS
uniref:Uncharacterized protein n=1 Tax=Candidatus Kentrum sp. UNK TaxID=2126344 RepID=A0A451A4K1_9GAMM|nr:MAG: hypothetical protein BECKUNK1418G_GA0071005_101430 [Candidatus Kentron sp. UNK]VFK69516.1 MAG: hypothetical protein BECKUNK1418H_GA0071006_101515 [Candidatus Kentron sp. UNK]